MEDSVDRRLEPPTKLICDEIKNSTDEMGLNAIDKTRVCKNIYNAKRSFLPKLPTNKNEVHTAILSLAWVTNRNERFVILNDDKNNIIIFGCRSNLLILQECSKVIMDGK